MEAEHDCNVDNASLTSISSEVEAQFIHEMASEYTESFIYIGEYILQQKVSQNNRFLQKS